MLHRTVAAKCGKAAAATPDHLSLIPRIHTGERENRLPQETNLGEQMGKDKAGPEWSTDQSPTSQAEFFL